MTDRRQAGSGLMRRGGRETTVAPAASGPSTPDTIFSTKVADWWDGSLGVGLVGGEANTWTGQTRGVVLTAAASTRRPTVNATDANFNGMTTLEGTIAGTAKCLRNATISPGLLLSTANPCVLIVGRFTIAPSAGTIAQMYSDGGGNFVYHTFINGAGVLRQRVIGAGSNVRNIDLTPASLTVPAVMRRQHQASGGAAAHNALTGTGTGDATLVGDANRFSLFSDVNNSDPADCVIAQVVVLNAIPSAGELTAYAAYTLTRFGV